MYKKKTRFVEKKKIRSVFLWIKWEKDFLKELHSWDKSILHASIKNHLNF